METTMKYFSPGQFTATRWSSAEEKAQFANHFTRFLYSGFSRALFSDGFYRRLSNTFGFIAQRDRDTFYEYYFTSLEGHTRFLDNIRQGGGYGDPTQNWVDVENALKEWLFEEALPADYREQLTGEDDGPLIVLYLLEIERVMDDKTPRLMHPKRKLLG
jgi:hypothetical protein